MGLIGWRNAVDDPATYMAANVAAGGMGAETLRVPMGNPAVAWQTPGGITSAELQFVAPANVAWRGVALTRTNLTSSALMRVQVGYPNQTTLGNLDLLGNLDVPLDLPGPVYDSGWINAGVKRAIRQALHILPAAASARTINVAISDPSNPDGNLNIPLCFAGPMEEFPVDASSDTGKSSRRADVMTRGGATRTETLSKQRDWQLRMALVAENEIEWLDELEDAAVSGRNILFVPRFPYERASSEAVFGLLVPGRRGFVDKVGKHRTWGATIVERI